MNQEQENLFRFIQYAMGYVRVRLGDVAETVPGERIVSKDLNPRGTIPVYSGSLKPLGYHTVANRPANSVFVIIKGNAGDIGYSTVPFFAGDGCLTIVPGERLLGSKFLYYTLTARRTALIHHVRHFGVSTLSRKDVEKLEIAVPALSEQERITAFLNQFNDVHIAGLKHEAELREKQSLYYHNQLFELLPESVKCPD